MHLRLAATAAFALASCLPGMAWARVAAPAPLTLDEAFARVARSHPELRLFGPQTDALLAERDQAGLRPPMHAGLDIENASGTGATRGFDAAEITFSLAGVLERGGKLDARRALAQSRIDALSVQREAQRRRAADECECMGQLQRIRRLGGLPCYARSEVRCGASRHNAYRRKIFGGRRQL